MEASQHSLLAACFTLHSINATLAIVPQRGAGLWITVQPISFVGSLNITCTPEPIFLKTGIYIMPPEDYSTEYFIKPSISNTNTATYHIVEVVTILLECLNGSSSNFSCILCNLLQYQRRRFINPAHQLYQYYILSVCIFCDFITNTY
jgi:hypothetical protein